MFCEKCGNRLNDGQLFCTQCGAPVKARQPQPQQPVYQQPTYQQPVQMQPDMPMKWFKLLIYFSLFAGAVSNILQGLSWMTGVQYGNVSEEIYEMFEEMKIVDILMGVSMIILGVLCIVTRFRLAGFYQNGPTLLKWVYWANAIIGMLYIITLYSILPAEVTQYIDFPSICTELTINIAFVVANTTYFNKRAHLFVR